MPPYHQAPGQINHLPFFLSLIHCNKKQKGNNTPQTVLINLVHNIVCFFFFFNLFNLTQPIGLLLIRFCRAHARANHTLDLQKIH